MEDRHDIPVITIFVRHSKDCKYRDDETWKRCDCRKHLRWTYAGKQVRQSAKSRAWAGAEAAKRRIEESFAVGTHGRGPVAKGEAAKTIRDAVTTFIASKKDEGVSQVVIKKYERELGRLEQFLTARGKFFPNQIQMDDLIDFRSGWQSAYPSSLTRQKVQERLRGWLRYCHAAGHIDRLPTLSPIKVDVPPTLPLTEKEYQRLLASIPKVFEKSLIAARVQALIRLMRHSGLAIRDAVTLERADIRMDKENNCFQIITSRQKTGTHVSVPIPKDVGNELLAVRNHNPKFVFWNGTSQPTTAVGDLQRKLRTLFRNSGFPKGHPHQLRDTFAVDLLAKGVPLQEVSKLLGHTSIKTTEKHYAPWVVERQKRLTAAVVATWDKHEGAA